MGLWFGLGFLSVGKRQHSSFASFAICSNRHGNQTPKLRCALSRHSNQLVLPRQPLLRWLMNTSLQGGRCKSAWWQSGHCLLWLVIVKFNRTRGMMPEPCWPTFNQMGTKLPLSRRRFNTITAISQLCVSRIGDR